MGKTGRWIRHFLTGKKDKEKKEKCPSNQNSSTIIAENPSTPISVTPTTPKEKRRWSFRRSSATGAAPTEANSAETNGTAESPVPKALDSGDEQRKHTMAMAAADAAVAAAKAASVVVRVTATADGSAGVVEEAAAIKIQSIFRSHLARKALCALRGLVKLQALVRGHLVRKQATTTLRCMQALVTGQARALAQRILAVEDGKVVGQRPSSVHRKSTHEHRFRQTNYDFNREENIKIVEMDNGEPKSRARGRNSYSHHPQPEQVHHKFSTHYASSAPSGIKNISPRTCSGHFEDYSFGTTQSSPRQFSAVSKPDPPRVQLTLPRPDYAETMSYDYPLFPNYMANTESSRAKARSQSAPKCRPDFERPPSASRRRPSMEGRNIPRAVRMQRSSSHVGSNAQHYQLPWHVKLDRSSVSLKDSECGSTSTVLTNANYCRSLVGFDSQGNRY